MIFHLLNIGYQRLSSLAQRWRWELPGAPLCWPVPALDNGSTAGNCASNTTKQWRRLWQANGQRYDDEAFDASVWCASLLSVTLTSSILANTRSSTLSTRLKYKMNTKYGVYKKWTPFDLDFPSKKAMKYPYSKYNPSGHYNFSKGNFICFDCIEKYKLKTHNYY